MLIHMSFHSEALGVNVRADVRYMFACLFTNALYNKYLFHLSPPPLILQPQTQCRGCAHVRPVVLLS